MSLIIEEKDREKVLAEISECQSRILQTLVPTIIAVGLISIADRENIATVTLISAFAVLFSSSLYVASLSYKIFRNASFIRALSDHTETGQTVHWEKALAMFCRQASPPLVIGYETKTIAVVYLVFSAAFVFMFYEMNHLLSLSLGLVLVAVALRILIIPAAADSYYRKWQSVLGDFPATAAEATTQHEATAGLAPEAKQAST